jgi:electron transfer flavoprotein alpha/beta subunit
MKIVVCIKQVPEVTNVQVDPVKGTLIREGVQSILNPFCEYALDHSIRIAKANPGSEVTAISMGPPQALDALRRCLELGADRAILVTDRVFAGADTWATAYTLSAAIRLAVPNFDLILAGKQAIDGDTAQVGPELAEIMALPQITYGVEAWLTPNQKRIQVKREIEWGYEVIEARLPALVTFSKGEVVRRLPSLKDLVASRGKPVQTIKAGDLDLPEDQLGLKGSFTQVIQVFPPPEKKSVRTLQNLEAEQAAEEIYAFLKENKFLE